MMPKITTVFLKLLMPYLLVFTVCQTAWADTPEVCDSAQVEKAGSSVVNGTYIYVPDSLQNDVIRLLEGHSKVVDDMNNLDTTERTIFKGDTIPMVLKQMNIGRFNRGLSNLLYIPKGVWAIGLTVSYGEIATKDLDIFGLLSDVNIDAHAFSIRPYLAYFIRNNISVGLKFGYYNARGGIDSFKVDVDDDINFSLDDIAYRSESYSAAFTFNQYIGLGRRSRFGVFNEVELAFSSGSSEFRRPYNSEPRVTKNTSMEAQLNFSPGIQVFIMKNVAFHVSFGVFGFYLRNEKQTENDVDSGNRFSSGANFRFNIFNINFGIAVNM
ncbi:MAG: hypothetical protein NC204_04995 [Candidatus Amulumruptor caecigallinarius]|nr:hypothetical protein [Candidatus Amulumruptor caecigallinarius]